MANFKAFDVCLRNAKAFTLTIIGFTESESFRFLSNNIVRIVSNISQILKPSLALRIKPPKISVLAMKFRTQLFTNINARAVRIVARTSAIIKQTASIPLSLDMTFVFRERIKVLSNIIIPKTRLSASPILGIFHKLSEYDPSTLATLDTQTLGALDYTAT